MNKMKQILPIILLILVLLIPVEGGIRVFDYWNDRYPVFKWYDFYVPYSLYALFSHTIDSFYSPYSGEIEAVFSGSAMTYDLSKLEQYGPGIDNYAYIENYLHVEWIIVWRFILELMYLVIVGIVIVFYLKGNRKEKYYTVSTMVLFGYLFLWLVPLLLTVFDVFYGIGGTQKWKTIFGYSYIFPYGLCYIGVLGFTIFYFFYVFIQKRKKKKAISLSKIAYSETTLS